MKNEDSDDKTTPASLALPPWLTIAAPAAADKADSAFLYDDAPRWCCS
ncbi:hypothetical protein KCP78_00860 [Salmonella enterica subsp. enterica]|nr:hypothetical protein KCP78_00860 [Salmonella enterica subsp. enterica]